jgi:hypothetical protein
VRHSLVNSRSASADSLGAPFPSSISMTKRFLQAEILQVLVQKGRSRSADVKIRLQSILKI